MKPYCSTWEWRGLCRPGQRERNVQIGKRVDKLEEKLHSGLEELRTALDGQREEHARQQDEHARHRRRVERQLAALVLGQAATMPKPPGIDESGGSGTRSGPPWWRPGEAAQRKVTNLIYEWWQARNSLIAAEDRLSIAMDWDIVADLAVRDESAEAFA